MKNKRKMRPFNLGVRSTFVRCRRNTRDGSPLFPSLPISKRAFLNRFLSMSGTSRAPLGYSPLPRGGGGGRLRAVPGLRSCGARTGGSPVGTDRMTHRAVQHNTRESGPEVRCVEVKPSPPCSVVRLSSAAPLPGY